MVPDAPAVVALSPPPGHWRAYAIDAVVAVEPARLKHLPLVPHGDPAGALGAAPGEVRARACRPGQVQAHPRARIIAVHPHAPPPVRFHDPHRHRSDNGRGQLITGGLITGGLITGWLITARPGLPAEELAPACQPHLVAVEHFVRGVAGKRQHEHVAESVGPVRHEEIAFTPVRGKPGRRCRPRNAVTQALTGGLEVGRYGIPQPFLLSSFPEPARQRTGTADQVWLTWIACEAVRFAMAAKTSSPRGVRSTSTHPTMAMIRPPNA